MNIKYLLLPIVALLLVGCQSTKPQIITVEKLKIVKPSSDMYDCPTIRSFPNPDKLTDNQVAKLIVQLYGNNQRCKNSIESIKRFLDESEKEINSK